MKTKNIPRHVAIIMDGNGRWAKKRLLPRTAGHRSSVKRVKELVQASAKFGVETLSLFAFSSENWSRPKEEVSTLMALFLKALNNEVGQLHENNVQLKIIGDISVLSEQLRNAIAEGEKLTANNTGLKLRVAVNYGGKWDITSAAKKIGKLIEDKKLKAADISDEVIDDNLSTRDVPPVDLLIRTSGEKRISNFFLWQAAYAELYFPDTLFPDFGEEGLADALAYFATRERRFGKV